MLLASVHGSRVAFSEVEPPDGALFLGTLDDQQCWAVDLGTGEDEGRVDAGAFTDLYSLWSRVDEARWRLAGRAVQIVEWERTHRFCGRCATPTEAVDAERARRCPACGLLAFPRLAPAVIVLIERDDGRVLLARNVRFPGTMFSCLAGFVEPGETLEEAVRREVAEEVGVLLAEVRYWGSQPWPFPHSLMVGFRARYRAGAISPQPGEIAEARWFARDELPDIPPGISIARALIDDWMGPAG
ncbi:MAG TPA: NAD(+) diphosphatase [Acidimicrobiales bacterium]|nr:NAD(+) diphosphatase [Acidimicrobiales bacterium]